MSTPAEKAQQASEANILYPDHFHPFTPKEDRRAALDAYREREREIRDQFERDLAAREHTLAGVPATKAKVFEYAWREGHAEGYQRVQEVYEEIADIVDDALDEYL